MNRIRFESLQRKSTGASLPFFSALVEAFFTLFRSSLRTQCSIVRTFLAAGPVAISAFVESSCNIDLEGSRLQNGIERLIRLIEMEDGYFLKHGKYLTVLPNSSNDSFEVRSGLKSCVTGCDGCDFAVAKSGVAFTAEVRCVLDNGTYYYQGYVRPEPGLHRGIDGLFGKCRSEGIFAGKRMLVNTVGPCYEQDDRRDMVILLGRKKRLLVQTMPSGATITVNGAVMGQSSPGHNTLSRSYGSYFWEDPSDGPALIAITKDGYQPVEFTLNWGSYTYKAAVALRLRQ